MDFGELKTKMSQRANRLDVWLDQIDAPCKTEQKHCEEGTVERAYWHHGYMMALRDILKQMEDSE